MEMFSTNNEIARIVLVLLLLHVIECSVTNLYVSNSKEAWNNPVCGRNVTNPCKTIAYAFDIAEKNNTQKNYLLLDAGDTSSPFAYTYKLDATISTSANLTVKPYTKDNKPTGVRPIIKMESGLVFLNDSRTSSLKDLHTLWFKNIHFYGISILNATGENLRVDIIDCFVEKTPKPVIYSNVNVAKIAVYLTGSKFQNCNGLIKFPSGVDVNIQISGSTVTADRPSPSFTGILIGNVTNRCIISIKSINLSKNNYKPSIFQNIYKPISALTTSATSASCSTKNTSKITISKSLFISNSEPIQATGCFTSNIQDSVFKLNSNGALLFTDTLSVYLMNATFEQNTGRSALTLIRNGKNIIQFSRFNANSDDYQGGAIFGYDNTINIQRSTFTSNHAPLSGGAIYHDASTKTDTELDLSDVTISSSFGKHTRQGGLLYSSQKLKLKDTKLDMQPGPLSNLDSYVDAMTSNLGIIVVPQGKFQMKCPAGSNLKLVKVGNTTRTGMNVKTGVYSMGCEKCPSQTFSLESAVITSSELEYNKVKCLPCPQGGNCSNRIISQNNFWGSKQADSKEFQFIQCPKGYCCSRDTTPCISYQTCHNNRDGTLCGKCKESYTLDFFSDKCNDNTNCNKLAFWILNILYALVIGGCFLNLEYIILSLDRVFKRRSPIVVLENSRNDEGLVNRGPDDTIDLCESPITSQRSLQNSKALLNSSGTDAADFIIGFGKIIAFFYQIEILLRVNSNRNYGVFSLIEDLVLSFFNYRFDSNRFSSFCPSTQMNHVTKEVTKLMTVLLSPVLMTLLYLPVVLKRRIQNKGHDTNSLKFCFRQCMLHLTLFSYTNIANFCIVMINCVDIFGKKYLFLHGETICYTTWQYLIFAFVFLWLVPFPFAMHFSVKLLHSHRITPGQFYSIMACPCLLIVFYSISAKSGGSSSGRVDADIKMEVDCILQVFTGPFREGKNGPTNGETNILVRRLILSVVCCAINDPVVRLFTSFPILLIFLLCHIHSRPFKESLSNGLETTSFTILLWFNATHLFWAFSYVNEWSNVTMVKQMVSIFNIVQDVLIAIPALVVLTVVLTVLLKKMVVLLFVSRRQNNED